MVRIDESAIRDHSVCSVLQRFTIILQRQSPDKFTVHTFGKIPVVIYDIKTKGQYVPSGQYFILIFAESTFEVVSHN